MKTTRIVAVALAILGLTGASDTAHAKRKSISKKVAGMTPSTGREATSRVTIEPSPADGESARKTTPGTAVPSASPAAEASPGAASADGASSASASSTSSGFAAPKPAPELARLAPWIGRWTATATFEKDGFIPQGGTSKGTYVVRKALNDQAYVGELLATGTGGKFQGLSVREFDAQAKKWKTWWFDSWTPGKAEMGTGTLTDDKTSVWETEADYNGQKLKNRITEKWTDRNHITQTYESDRGQGLKKVLEVKYVRK